MMVFHCLLFSIAQHTHKMGCQLSLEELAVKQAAKAKEEEIANLQKAKEWIPTLAQSMIREVRDHMNASSTYDRVFVVRHVFPEFRGSHDEAVAYLKAKSTLQLMADTVNAVPELKTVNFRTEVPDFYLSKYNVNYLRFDVSIRLTAKCG
jgi:hypothetical protein